MQAINAFVEGLLDYAGLFPPASLDLATALANYDTYSRHSWSHMLGRFVVPSTLLGNPDLPPRLTVTLAGPPLPALPVTVESVESKSIFAAPDNIRIFYELDWSGDYRTEMDRLAGRPNAAVKLRTGGESVPPAATVAAFLRAAADRKLPIKFTAGLHHALPEDGQHGLVNVFCAAFVAYSSQDDPEPVLALREFQFTQDALTFEGYKFLSAQIQALRKQAVSFGSCNFEEPVQSLIELLVP